MTESPQQSICASCNRSYSIDQFQSRSNPARRKKKCRNCRRRKSTSSVNNSAASLDQVTKPSTSKAAVTTSLASCSFSTATEKTQSASSEPQASTITSSNAESASSSPSRIQQAITAAVCTTKLYTHIPPPGLFFSGPMDPTKSIQKQRRFLVPPNVVRVAHSDFPKLTSPLEDGMVSHSPGCLECSLKGIHCTYGAGVRVNGKAREVEKGKCDYCIFTTRKCKGNGFDGYKANTTGGLTELGKALDGLRGLVDTCVRAQEADRAKGKDRNVTEKVQAKGLVKKIEVVRGRLGVLSEQLAKQSTASTDGKKSGTVGKELIVIENDSD